jgi:hypothetical protein
MRVAGLILLALLFAPPILGLHVFARYYVEPSAALDEGCKDAKSRPGSRAEVI